MMATVIKWLSVSCLFIVACWIYSGLMVGLNELESLDEGVMAIEH